MCRIHSIESQQTIHQTLNPNSRENSSASKVSILIQESNSPFSKQIESDKPSNKSYTISDKPNYNPKYIRFEIESAIENNDLAKAKQLLSSVDKSKRIHIICSKIYHLGYSLMVHAAAHGREKIIDLFFQEFDDRHLLCSKLEEKFKKDVNVHASRFF